NTHASTSTVSMTGRPMSFTWTFGPAASGTRSSSSMHRQMRGRFIYAAAFRRSTNARTSLS
ncbi:MAG: hypothetical protein ACYSYL_20710, partial [Planctomycetota bacterium]